MSDPHAYSEFNAIVPEGLPEMAPPRQRPHH
jgi:hypothetical protein